MGNKKHAHTHSWVENKMKLPILYNLWGLNTISSQNNENIKLNQMSTPTCDRGL